MDTMDNPSPLPQTAPDTSPSEFWVIQCNRTQCVVNSPNQGVTWTPGTDSSSLGNVLSQYMMYIIACTCAFTFLMSIITCLLVMKLVRVHSKKPRTDPPDEKSRELASTIREPTRRSTRSGGVMRPRSFLGNSEVIGNNPRQRFVSIRQTPVYAELDSHEFEASQNMYVASDMSVNDPMRFQDDSDITDDDENNLHLDLDGGDPLATRFFNPVVKYSKASTTHSKDQSSLGTKKEIDEREHPHDYVNQDASLGGLDVQIPPSSSSENVAQTKKSKHPRPVSGYLAPIPSDAGYLMPDTMKTRYLLVHQQPDLGYYVPRSLERDYLFFQAEKENNLFHQQPLRRHQRLENNVRSHGSVSKNRSSTRQFVERPRSFSLASGVNKTTEHKRNTIDSGLSSPFMRPNLGTPPPPPLPVEISTEKAPSIFRKHSPKPKNNDESRPVPTKEVESKNKLRPKSAVHIGGTESPTDKPFISSPITKDPVTHFSCSNISSVKDHRHVNMPVKLPSQLLRTPSAGDGDDGDSFPQLSKVYTDSTKSSSKAPSQSQGIGNRHVSDALKTTEDKSGSLSKFADDLFNSDKKPEDNSMRMSLQPPSTSSSMTHERRSLPVFSTFKPPDEQPTTFTQNPSLSSVGPGKASPQGSDKGSAQLPPENRSTTRAESLPPMIRPKFDPVADYVCMRGSSPILNNKALNLDETSSTRSFPTTPVPLRAAVSSPSQDGHTSSVQETASASKQRQGSPTNVAGRPSVDRNTKAERKAQSLPATPTMVPRIRIRDKEPMYVNSYALQEEDTS